MRTVRKYLPFKATHSVEVNTIRKLSTCVSEVQKLLTDNFLQLDTDKTKFLLFDRRNQPNRLKSSNQYFNNGIWSIIAIAPRAFEHILYGVRHFMSINKYNK